MTMTLIQAINHAKFNHAVSEVERQEAIKILKNAVDDTMAKGFPILAADWQRKIDRLMRD